MLRLYRFAPHKLSISRRVLGLRVAAVLGAEPLEEGFDRLGETSIGSRLRCPGRVASRRGDGEESQDGDTRRLVLIRHIRVKPSGSQSVLSLPSAVLVVRTKVNIVELEMILDMGADRLHFQTVNSRQADECSRIGLT